METLEFGNLFKLKVVKLLVAHSTKQFDVLFI
uniref:Uncharacterized protein n=1 Tax=Rhizophora mucronata TaxID=61149 RepID=A0A2P2NG68_RHIMU